MPATYSIRDLERLTGIKAHTLRVWEQRYQALQPDRTVTNIRRYSDHELRRLLNISLLNNHGYKINVVAKFSDEQLTSEVTAVMDLTDSPGDHALFICLLQLDERRFQKILQTAISSKGFESTMEQLVFPFLRKLGGLWQVGTITVAHEHYLSQIIRQKLFAAIDAVDSAPVTTMPLLFFLPDQELHELGLLYAYYLSKKAGIHSIYLGQSVPNADLITLILQARPKVLISSTTTTVEDSELMHLIGECNQKLPGLEFWLSGRQLVDRPENKLSQLQGVTVLNDFESFRLQLKTASLKDF